MGECRQCKAGRYVSAFHVSIQGEPCLYKVSPIQIRWGPTGRPLCTYAPLRLALFRYLPSPMNLLTRQSDITFEGAFARIERLPDGVVQIRYKDHFEIEIEHIRAITRCIFELSPHEKATVLVDRNTPYSVSFEAQQFIMYVDRLAAVAYLVYNPLWRGLAELAGETYLHHVPVRVFAQREIALAWLESFRPVETPV